MPHKQKDPAAAELSGPSQSAFLAGCGREATDPTDAAQVLPMRTQLLAAANRNDVAADTLGGSSGLALRRLAAVFRERARAA